jgi:hypothetical protein
MDDLDARDLLRAISEHLEGMADHRAVEVRSVVDAADAGRDLGALADELRDLRTARREVMPSETP